MKRIFGLLSLGGGAVSGLLGVIGALGFCSAPWIVALFALFGLNSMLLATYNRLFLFIGVLAFGLAALLAILPRKEKCAFGKGEDETKNAGRKFLWIGIIGILGLTVVNGVMLLNNLPKSTSPNLSAPAANKDAQAYLKFKQIKASIIPSGIPAVYGEELNISFDKAQEAINAVSPFDPTYGSQKIVLVGGELERYKKIGSLISCEYCCGAKTLVFENGEAACGCDHSQMMRGLAAWLIQNHPEVSDEQVLGELKKWKAVFFPQQTLTTKIGELEKAGEPGIKELLQEFPDFLPKMVGGC